VFKLLLALHLLFAVFAVGPLVGAATTAARAVRTGDGAASAAAARMLRSYAIASVLVVVLGFGLMSLDNPYGPGKVAEFGDTWIWLSLVLWLVAVGVTLAVLVPALTRVGAATGAAASSVTARVAASGGVVGILFAVIIFLMVYRPGD
jgi:uncharacterized membrane protein